jgi:hypothetical protein
MEIIGFILYLLFWIAGSPYCVVLIVLLLGLTWLMVRRRSGRIKWAALGIVVATGVYCVFCNDLSGPEMWMICDSPINWPKFWHYNWRLWWIGQIGLMTAWRAGMIVAAMMIIIKLYHLIQKYI